MQHTPGEALQLLRNESVLARKMDLFLGVSDPSHTQSHTQTHTHTRTQSGSHTHNHTQNHTKSHKITQNHTKITHTLSLSFTHSLTEM